MKIELSKEELELLPSALWEYSKKMRKIANNDGNLASQALRTDLSDTADQLRERIVQLLQD